MHNISLFGVIGVNINLNIMKNNFLLFLFFLFAINTYAQETKFKGVFKGQNLYILNPLNETDNTYCITEIVVNGKKSKKGVLSSAFELNFSDFKIKKGADIIILFKHKNNCEPSIVNLGAISGKKINKKIVKKNTYIEEPKNAGFGIVTGSLSNTTNNNKTEQQSTVKLKPIKFEIINAKVSKKNILKWETKGEKNILPFIVEQYRWNRWVFVCEVKGYGAGNENKYEINVIPHPGDNRFRISQKGNFGEIRYSDVVKFSSNVKPIKLDLSRVTNFIKFPKACLFEIVDLYGNMVLSGFSYKADLRKLDPGKYFINYDNVTKEFKRKKSKIKYVKNKK